MIRPPSRTRVVSGSDSTTATATTARRIPLAASSSSSSSSIPLSTTAAARAPRLGLGLPPSRRASVTATRLGQGAKAPATTPKRASTLRTSTVRSLADHGTTTTTTTTTSGGSTSRTVRPARERPIRTATTTNAPRSPAAAASSSSSSSSRDARPRTAQPPLPLPRASLENRQLSRLRHSTSSSAHRAPLSAVTEQSTPTKRTPRTTTTTTTPSSASNRTRAKPRGSTTLEELLQHGLFSSDATDAASSSPYGLARVRGGGGGGGGGGRPSVSHASEFEFLMDEHVSRIMMDEINAVGSGLPGGEGGTPWRGRVVSLSMSGRSRRDASFELADPSPSPRRVRTDARGTTEHDDVKRTTGDEPADEDEEEEEEEEEQENEEEEDSGSSRQVLVLQRADEAAQVDALRKDKEALERDLAALRSELERRSAAETVSDDERAAWDRDKRELTRALEASEGTTRFKLARVEALAAYRASREGYEAVAGAAARDKDEVVGALDALRLIATGLAVVAQ
ncbi:hypothetical protein JCM11491_001824 [Sporobolomyces phaffii]